MQRKFQTDQILRVLQRSASPIFAAAAICSVSFCLVGTAISLSKGFGADAAAWVQAAGSIAAIAGAVLLHRIESIRQRRHRRREREEIAWGVRFAIRLARNEAYTVAHELVDREKARASKGGRHWRTRCRNARRLLKYYASRPDHIHPAIAQEANNALLLAEEMETDVETGGRYLVDEKWPPLELAEDLAWYEIQFAMMLERIDDRMVQVGQALDRGEDMLPLTEVWPDHHQQRARKS